MTAAPQGSDDFADERPPAEPGTGTPQGESELHAEHVQAVDEAQAPAGTDQPGGAPPAGGTAPTEATAQPGDGTAQPADGTAQPSDGTEGPEDPFPGDALNDAAVALAADLRSDLQRLQAEYVNYRKRVERDRNVARDSAIAGVLESLLPVLDDIELARQHGDLEGGPFAAISEKLEAVLGRFGLARYGAAGEEFDPTVHEALMHSHSDEVQTSTVTQVLQPGYTLGEKVLRAARVAVTDPQ